MEITYEMTKKEMLTAFRFGNYYSKPFRAVAILLGLPSLIVTGYVLSKVILKTSTPIAVSLALLGMLAAIGLTFPIVSRLWLESSLGDKKGERMILRLESNGIRLITEDSELFRPWRGIRSAISKRGFLLIIGRTELEFCVPKRAFIDENQLKEFESHISAMTKVSK